MKKLSKSLVAFVFVFTLIFSANITPVKAFGISSFTNAAIWGNVADAVKGLFKGGSDSEKGKECISKPLSELEDAHKQSTGKSFVYSKVGHASVSQSEEDKKKEICAELINGEDEDDTTFSETFLWKPVSDSDGKAVTLLPTSLSETVIAVELLDAESHGIEKGRFTGNANGHRNHYRFSKPGSSYGNGIQVVAVVPEGAWIWRIPNGGQRFESGKGRFVTNAEMAAWDAAHAAEAAAAEGSTVPSIGDFGNSCPTGFFDTNTNKSLKVMAMGDSNTKGSDASNLIGYRKAFKDDMTAMGYTVDMVGSQSAGSGFSDNQHEGYPGEGLAKLQQVANGSSLTANNPDVILLLVGSNDMWISLDNRSPISDSAANSKVVALGNLIDTIHTKVPSALVIVAKPGTPLTGGWAAPRPLGIYSTGIDTIATTRSYVSVVDFTSFKGNGDGTHYDATGYGKIAETFAKKIDELKRKCEEEKNNTPTTATSTPSTSQTKLEVECKVSDTTLGVDDEVDIWIEVSGGKTPYDGTWSGDYKKADNFDKDEPDQTISFEKKGNYKMKITVEDADGEKAKDTCPTIKVSKDGENDKVTVRSENDNSSGSAQESEPTSNYSYYRDLTMGSRGEDVVALQNFLISSGYLVIPAGVDKGYFGELTRVALGNWQTAHGVTPSAGYFGPRTRAAITGGAVQSYTPIQQPIYVPVINNSTITTSTAADTCVNLSNTIYFGEENEDVSRVQKFLVSGGYLVMPEGASYGYYGRTTVSALSRFMAVRGIAHNGAIIDAKVLEQVKAVTCQ